MRHLVVRLLLVVHLFSLELVSRCERVWAHDFWLEPSSFRLQVGEVVGVRLKVGVQLVGLELPREVGRIRSFEIVSPEGVGPVRGVARGKPAGLLQTDSTGTVLIGYESFPSETELQEDVFLEYLHEEGFDEILSLWNLQDPGHSPGIERFSRCAKTILHCGTRSENLFGERFGHTLELIPEADPSRLMPGDVFPCQLLFRGRPLQGAHLTGLHKKNLDSPPSGRTDASGRAELKLDHPGMWVIKTVHLIPTTGSAYWESYWATLSFEIRH